MSKFVTSKDEIFNAIHKIIEEGSFLISNEDDFMDEDNVIGYTNILLENQHEEFDYEVDDKVLILTNKVYINIKGDKHLGVDSIDRINSKVKAVFKPDVSVDYGLKFSGDSEIVEVTVFLLKIKKNLTVMQNYN